MKMTVNLATITVAVALLTACAPEAKNDPAVEAKNDPAVEAMRAAAEAENQMTGALATVITAWDTGNTDTLDAIMSPGVQRTAPDKNVSSLDEYKALIAGVHTVYPDFRITNDGSAIGQDSGFVQWTVTGTDSGSENATGNSMKATGITKYQFENGKIVSELVVFDTAAVLTQLQSEELPHGGE
ncbi:MAG: nuclear transport factor 2 family protein [Woeseiaceae bacterium]